ncbi:ligase-associated DNA damage response DEXH box helicase [Filomicrobium sp.]|uniref:ligase-associated DNA damage response DEXH box helicase n=1 Tax=Filomicrobium sp. TaxID=2024831 RepID=UPI0025838548|nr:ligase-associated DNA damage response DEXH box helicase [Filomicrobium sp.]MCV0367819.1 ligase-associated DNA damage response DEXH box helicase [Filomicrobium sp.]
MNDKRKPSRVLKRSSKPPARRGRTRCDVSLPQVFQTWFKTRGWTPRPHQLALLKKARARTSTLLIAPTGAGKTLAGFLPSLVELSQRTPEDVKGSGLHTLYISPLKALAVDIARNLGTPIAEMGLDIVAETRTGDTPASRRARQRSRPPSILLTTPEQVALLLAHPDAGFLFADLKTVILDELHALCGSKRGDLLSLDLARLRSLAPDLVALGLSATVARPSELRAYLTGQHKPDARLELADLVVAAGGAEPQIEILELETPVPWSGHTTRYAMTAVYDAIAQHRLTLVFVNTRMQAELVFQELWRINEGNLRIALHHGSLDVGQRRKVEAAMAAGRLDAVVATSTLDLGIDWGDIDLVINVGAPKGASRLAQRIGRANHRLDEPSHALLVPSNRFEVLECRAALDAALAGEQDVVLARTGGLDVLAQHVLGMACQAPFAPDDLYREVRSASPYSGLKRETFDRVLSFVSMGGYALAAYERFAKLRPTGDGRWRIANGRVAQAYRLNVGTIVESPLITVRLVGRGRTPRAGKTGRPGGERALMGGRVLGEVDEDFIDQLSPGQTFVFAGEIVRFEGLRDTEAFVSRATATDAMIPSYPGGKFPLSTHLAKRVRAMLHDRRAWADLPLPVAEWLGLQDLHSLIPSPDEVLVETFPRGSRHYLVAYPFEGRLAHQTLGMLLTRRLERAGARPLGFVANDYGLAVWGLGELSQMIEAGKLSLDQLFEQDMLGDDLEAWLAESSLMKRTFRMCAVIAGLIERHHPGHKKSGRQVTMSTDLIYDVLRKFEPGHVLLEAAWADAASGLLDIARLGAFLQRVRGHIVHRSLGGVSPLSVPILLEIGREPAGQAGREDILRDAAEALIREAKEGPARD